MLNFAVSTVIYLFEMLIAYMVFSSVNGCKWSTVITTLFGAGIFTIASLANVAFSNTVWINALSSMICTLLFAVICFSMRLNTALVYVVLMSIFSAVFELVTIFVISSLTGENTTSYNSDMSLLLMEAFISKTMYLFACVLLLSWLRHQGTVSKINASFFLLPAGVLFALLAFWYICAHEQISDGNQFLLALTSAVLLGSTIMFFLTYQHGAEKDSEYLQMKTENDRLQTEKAYYDILERQNEQLMLYAHDAKNHLSAIQSLSHDPNINEYISKLQTQLVSYSSGCHSGNRTLDVIINKYRTECELHNVKFSYDTKLCNLSCLQDIDLVAILGNLLDNALTAAASSRARIMSIETGVHNTYNIIVISNSCDTPPNCDGSALVTTKNDRAFHGLGLKSVKRVLTKYAGDFDLQYEDENHMFYITVMLKAPKDIP